MGTGSAAPRRIEDTILVGRWGTDSAWHRVAARLLKVASVLPGMTFRERSLLWQVFERWRVSNAYKDSRDDWALPLPSARATRAISLR